MTRCHDKIDQYLRSNKETEISDVDKRLRHNVNDICGGEDKLAEMKPELENLKKEAEDR